MLARPSGTKRHSKTCFWFQTFEFVAIFCMQFDPDGKSFSLAVTKSLLEGYD
jgi:hypothetical protein